MAVNVTMPKLGAAMTVGKIIEWKKKEEDAVQKEEIIVIVETDKVSYEVDSPVSGILHIISFEESEVEVGKVIAVIAENRSEYDQMITGGISEKEVAPDLGIVEPGAELSQVVGAAGLGPMKTLQVKTSPRIRVLAKQKGIDLSLIQGTGPGGRVTEKDVLSAMEVSTSRPSKPDEKVRISPVARKMVEEMDLDITQVEGTGVRDKITREDVERHLEPHKTPYSVTPLTAGEIIVGEGDRLEKFTGMRRVIAQKMVESKAKAPHAYLDVSIDCTALLAYKDEIQPYVEKKTGVRITITDILMKLTACAIKEHPIVNTRYTEDGILWLSDIHMGMAMAIASGLIVPVIRNIDKKSLTEVVKEKFSLVDRGRKRKLTADDISGSTFTFSSLGMYQIDHCTGIINQPESAILTVSSILKKAWVVNDQLTVRPIMNVSISVDHRVIYGAEAAMFMQTVRSYVEKPNLGFI